MLMPRLTFSTLPSIALHAVVCAGLIASTGCDVFTTPPSGSLGEEGAVYFQPEVEGVVSVPLMVGSRFTMKAVGNGEDYVAPVLSGLLVSTNSNVFEIVDGSTQAGEIRVSGPGTGTIEVHTEDGERLDSITLSAETAATLELLDAKLVGASVDARLPPRFALIEGNDAPMFIAAESECGTPLLALGGIDAVFDDDTLLTFDRSEDAGDLTHFLAPLAVGAVGLTLSAEGGASIDYEIEIANADDVTAVENTAAASESPTVEFWGRAYVNSVEVIGLDYNWSSPNGRVSVSRNAGSNVIASVSFPAEGEPEDPRPAEIQAEVFGVTDVVDIFLLQSTDLVGQRVEPKDTTQPSIDPTGCTGDSSSGTCGAALLGGLWLLRRRRRRS